MSTPPPRHSTNLLHPVRQQLDELDSLLQHMLKLPVEPADPPQPSVPPWGAEEREANGNPVILETSRLELDSPGGPSFSDFQFTSSNHEPETVAADLTPLPLPEAGTGETPPALLGKGSGGLGGARDPRTSFPLNDVRDEEISLWLVPLIALNRVVDGCLGRLGRPGRWWQGTWGRACLGLMGLLLLGGALLWGILDWMQWTW
jgi:hypothetical protein